MYSFNEPPGISEVKLELEHLKQDADQVNLGEARPQPAERDAKKKRLRSTHHKQSATLGGQGVFVGSLVRTQSRAAGGHRQPRKGLPLKGFLKHMAKIES